VKSGLRATSEVQPWPAAGQAWAAGFEEIQKTVVPKLDFACRLCLNFLFAEYPGDYYIVGNYDAANRQAVFPNPQILRSNNENRLPRFAHAAQRHSHCFRRSSA
jgi:hypothetical protein